MKSNINEQYGKMSKTVSLEMSPDTMKKMNDWLADILHKNLIEERRKKINKIRKNGRG
jgi:hypothetical protein